MAELVSNKSTNVVSNNSNMKSNDVCGVQSNNGLIDLDNITTSNNQLITMCDEPDDDDDLIMTKNTKNELSAEDKSLQEMIESELALRICSATANEDANDLDDDDDDTPRQPEITIKKIILEPRPDPLDINVEFIGAEMEHYAIVQDPYTYRNGHASPSFVESRSPEGSRNDAEEEFISTVEKYDMINDDVTTIQGQITMASESDDLAITSKQSENVRSEDAIVEDEIFVRSESEPDCRSNSEVFKFIKTTTVAAEHEKSMADEPSNEVVETLIIGGKHSREENEETGPIDETTTWIGSDNMENVIHDVEISDAWDNRSTGMEINSQIGQFSDDFGAGFGRNAEAEEPEEDQHREFSMESKITSGENIVADDNRDDRFENSSIDADENSKTEADIAITSANNADDSTKNIVDLDVIVVESDGNLESFSTEDSSSTSKSLMDNDFRENMGNVDNEIVKDIAKTNCFINEERVALANENDGEIKLVQIDENGKPEGNVEDDGTKATSVAEDNRLHPENDVRVYANVVESFSSNDCFGRNEEPSECDDSWMTVEEATNDRNKLPETTNEDNAKMFDCDHVTRINEDSAKKELGACDNEEALTNKTTNGVESFVADERKINSASLIDRNDYDDEDDDDDDDDDEDEDNQRSCNVNKIDKTFLQDATAATTIATCLILPGNTIVAPLAAPEDEINEFSNVCDTESREEVITSSTVVTSSSIKSTKSSTKTKKKKIEGVAGNDASPTLTPRTKKTKKSKKNDLEKENISVNINTEDSSMHTASRQMIQDPDDFSDENDLSNVNVKSLTQTYVSETSRGEQEKSNKEVIETGVSIKQLCRSFGDISNMTDVDQAGFGISEHTSETQEKAKSMDDLRLCRTDFKKLARDATVFVGVSVKALRASYCSLANLTTDVDEEIRSAARANRLKFEKSSFNKFDALTKKSVLNVRSVDAGKAQQQLNSVGQNGDANQNCRSCGKVVFQMEQTKAEGLVWHKNCFRCVQCSKQLNVDNYQSHESTLYCKAHFKELFQPKPVEESDQPVRPRKPEMIIRENQPKELPPDVVRASDKPDLGLEELSSLNVKSRFQVFEKSTNDTTNEIERSPSQVVKRSPSILSKLAKFQAKGMDIGVADDSLNGIPYEESSESEEEEEIEESEELDTEIVKSKRTTRERPISFTKMDDIKNRWECTSQQGRRESQREARKEEIAGIRSRLFMGKQGKMKEMYQQAVAESERVTKMNPTEEIQHSTHARSIKERFERGEPIATSDGEEDTKLKQEKPDEEVIAAGISRKSRSLFLELDASAAKTGRPVTPVNPKTPTDVSRRARDAFMGRQVSEDVVRSYDTTEEVQVETSDISNKFKFFETYKEPAKERKQFRITPPRDGLVKPMGSPEREIYRDPDVVRADDRVDEVVHTDTARKMLSIFRQMEEKATKEDIPDGPKPLKRFTPPPEDKFAKATASESEDEEEEEGEESEGEESGEERDPNYVRASDKVEDEFLKQAQNAARAKTLRAKFEQWETTDGKVMSHHVAEMDMAQGNGDQASIESASSLRARFESLGSQPSDSPRAPKVKVNRFVEIQTICMDVCESCQKKVYPLEKVETNNKIFHKQCFRCLQCNCVLRMDTFTLNNGKLYCIPHFKQLFIARGNYDEGFGVDPHKNKWSTNTANSTTAASAPAIAVSNGRANSVSNRV